MSCSALTPGSPENAWLQAPRISNARGIALERVQTVVVEHTEGRELGIFGEPRVNVLELNLALDRLTGGTG